MPSMTEAPVQSTTMKEVPLEYEQQAGKLFYLGTKKVGTLFC